MENFKIAVIDEGVDTIFHEDLNIVADLYVNENLEVIKRHRDVKVYSDHGLCVCSIINKYAPSAEIVSLKISDSSEMRSSVDRLKTALEYCLRVEEIKLINISIGSIYMCDNHFLEPVIKKIIKKGKYIISAQHNKRGLSLPALYSDVFSVRAKERDDINYGLEYLNKEIYEKSVHRYNIFKYNKTTQMANSYATPYFTAKLYNQIINCEKSEMDFHKVIASEFFGLSDTLIVNNSNILLGLKNEVIFKDWDLNKLNTNICYLPNKDKILDSRTIDIILKYLEDNDLKYEFYYVGVPKLYVLEVLRKYNIPTHVLPTKEIYSFKIKSKFHCRNKIYIESNNTTSMKFCCLLNNRFHEDRYNSILVSNVPHIVLFGGFYFTRLNNNLRLMQIEFAFEPEIEIIYGEQCTYKSPDNMYININCLDGDTKAQIRYEDNILELPMNNYEEFLKVYKIILDL